MSAKRITRPTVLGTFLVMFLVACWSGQAIAGEYDNALQGVTQVKSVFDVSQGSPKMANIVFWAVKNVYEDESVKSLPAPAKIAVVFHGPAVKLISSDRSGLDEEEIAEVEKFQETLREMKKAGVTLEVCDYALKVMQLDPATVMPEVDHVGNGFVSVIGYQAQGYAVVRIP
jgi:intracellular sulfur oxidation DsrE/DsrF family protein